MILVHCGNGSFATIVQNPYWVGWVMYDVYRQTVSQTALWTYVVLSVLGNTLVIVWRCSRPTMNRVSVESLLIVNLAVSDLFSGLHRLLFQCSLYQCRTTEDSFPVRLCQAGSWFFMAGDVSTYFTTTLIAVNAFLSIMNFNFWTARMQRWSISIVILLIWMTAIGSAFAYVLLFYDGYREVAKLGYYADWARCSPITRGLAYSNHPNAAKFSKTLFSVGNALMVGLVILCIAIGVRLFMTLRDRRQQQRNIREQSMDSQHSNAQVAVRGAQRIGITLFIVAIVNVVSLLLPVFRYIFATPQRDEKYSPSRADFIANATIAGIILQMRSAVDPIIYTVASRLFWDFTVSAYRKVIQACRKLKKLRVRPVFLKHAPTCDTTDTTVTTSAWETQSVTGAEFQGRLSFTS